MPVCSFIRSFIQSFGRYQVTSGGPGCVLTSGNRNQEQTSALTEHSGRLEKKTLWEGALEAREALVLFQSACAGPAVCWACYPSTGQPARREVIWLGWRLQAAGLMSPLQGEGRKGGLFLYSKVCALY